MLSLSLETCFLGGIISEGHVTIYFCPEPKKNFFACAYVWISLLAVSLPLTLCRQGQVGITSRGTLACSKVLSCCLIENLMSYLRTSRYESTLFYFFDS